MKNLNYLIVFILIQQGLNNNYCKAQNLVPNPSFENYSSCPNGVNSCLPDDLTKCSGWFSANNSPDYYNSCASLATNVSVPNNYSGTQLASSGQGYCGIQTYSFTPNYHEILSCQLTADLVVGTKYFVTFQVVNSGIVYDLGQGFNCCTNKMGALFSTMQFSCSNQIPLNNFAHIYSDTIIKDTILWKSISGSFIADSAYRYLNIGNFFLDANTDTFKYNTLACRSYYLIDNICVSTDSLFANNWASLNEGVENNDLVWNLFPNPSLGYIKLTSNFQESFEIFIFNSMGENLINYRFNSINEFKEIDFSGYASGIYTINILYKNKSTFLKFLLMN